MSEKQKSFAVIGGGFCGLACVAMLKDEGYDPICFEKTDGVGGTWNYREESVEGLSSIMPTTIINISKELTALSDFPPKKELNNYMRHFECYKYMMDYCAAKDVLKHVRVNREVQQVKKSSDYEDTGRWVVTIKDTTTGIESTDTYDGVMVCIGHVNRPKFAKYPGQEEYKGKVMHTHGLKSVFEFKDKNVVVVGMGCSALDAAVELSSLAKQVYLSTRSGAHVINRVGSHGLPIDYILVRRYLTTLLDIFPTRLCAWYLTKFYIDPKFDHRLYPVPPKYNILSKDPSVSDHLASRLLSGAVVQKKDIDRFTENGVIFDSEFTETQVDAVIMATGYDWKFPFLEDGIVVQENGRINLYKCIWPPHLKHPTLAILGFLLPFGPGFPAGELQCRWAAHVFAGKGKLPSEKVMMKEIKKRHKNNVKRYQPSDKMSLRVDYVPYMDSLAKEIKANPNFAKLFFTDIRLFYKLWFGPCLSYQYRLRGPHKWDGARDAIMNSRKRLIYSIKN